MKLKIMTKLIAGFLSVVVLLALVAVVAVTALSTVTAKYEDLTGRIDENTIQARTLEASMIEEARAVAVYMVTREVRYRDDFDEAKQRADESLAFLQQNVKSTEGQAILKRIEQAKVEYGSVAQDVLKRSSFTDAELRELTSTRLREPRTALMTAVDELVAYQYTRGDEVRQEAKTATSQAQWMMLIVAVLAAGIGLGIAVLMGRAISRPVNAVASTAQRLADGDLTVDLLRVSSRDEVGDMATSINQMVENLRQLIQGVSANTESVMSASEELSAAAEQTAQAAQQAAQGVGQVAAGASEQAHSANEVQSTMDQLQQTIQQIASGAGQSASEVQRASQLLTQMAGALQSVASNVAGVAEGSERAARTAKGGAEVVGETVAGMERIRRVVGETADRIRQLEALSAQIGDITETISGIADQTNLLALNAAIEAARAGEHGRGFAVVAEEVRKLAERSSASAKEINGLISNIQGRTAEAVRTMELGTAEVENGGKLATDAGRSLEEILATVEGTAQDVKGIAQAIVQVQSDAQNVVRAFEGMAAVTEENTAATEEMAAGATQVTNAVDRITGVAQDNAAATEEVSSSVEEVTASSEEVASSAQSLAKIAQDLQQQVARFQV